MKTLWKTHPHLLISFLLVAALALFFAGRILWGVVYWAEHRNEDVQPWMTVGYVGRSWDIDPREIDLRAGLPLPEGHPLTLQEIASQRGVPVAEIVALVEATIAEMQAERDAAHGGKDDKVQKDGVAP
jgi:hypothetical protein